MKKYGAMEKNYGAMEKKTMVPKDNTMVSIHEGKNMVDYQNLSNFIFNVKIYDYMQK